MARPTNLAALLAPLKGYAFFATLSDGQLEGIVVGYGKVSRYMADGAYRIDSTRDWAINLSNNGLRNEWSLSLGNRESAFTATPAATVKRVLKLVKALEEAGLISKPPAEFQPYVVTFDGAGERVYTDIFPA